MRWSDCADALAGLCLSCSQPPKTGLPADAHIYRYQFSHSFDPKSVSHAVTMGLVPSRPISLYFDYNLTWLQLTDPTQVCRIQLLTTNSQNQGHNFGSNLVRNCYTRNLIYWHNTQPPSPKFKVTTSSQMSVQRSCMLRVLSVSQ